MATVNKKPVVLPSHRVDVVEPGVSPQRHRIECQIGQHVKFETAGLETYCFANWDARVFDAFVLAAAVQFCDHTRRRPSTRWGREIELRMPVHDPTLWGSTVVSDALLTALDFLTGDRWHIEFIPRKKGKPVVRQGNFELPDVSRVIIPFSDGLDSRAVAGLMERDYGRSLIRLRLGQRKLDQRNMERRRIPFAVVPYRVQYGRSGSVEASALSRGFKFALLTGIAAYLSGTSQVIVPESGQGALGPVLVPVGQAYEDYRSHPLFTDRMSAFLSALFGHEVKYTYPRLWSTKAETLAAFIAACPHDKNWSETRSCWQGPRHVSVSGRLRQCGVCAACMLRRMSLHAVGVAEPSETYVWENLSAKRFEDGAVHGFKIAIPRGAQYEYAIAGTLHLDHLAGLPNSSINQISLDRQIFQLSRSLALSEHKTKQMTTRLLIQHGKEWREFVAHLGVNSFVSHWVLGESEHVDAHINFARCR